MTNQTPDVITLLAEVLAQTQAPRSMGMLGAATKPWDELRVVLKLFGYMTPEEIEVHLRKHLEIANGFENLTYVKGYRAGQRAEILRVLKAQHEAIDRLFAMLIVHSPVGKTFHPTKSGQPWEAIIAGNDLIKKLEAE